MVNPKLGVKRTCPETGKNFYDLNKDPVVSPYTDKEYPLTFFETGTEQKKITGDGKAAKVVEEDFGIVEAIDETDGVEPEIIALSEVEEEENDNIDNDEEVISGIPDIDVDDDVKLEDDTFLEEDTEDSDLSNVIDTQNSNNKNEA